MPEAIAAILPAPGAFSLAAARMRWPLSEVDCVSVHNRAVENVYMHFHPGARLLILTRNGETPAQIADALCQRGYGPSRMTVLESMGGPDEARRDGTAEGWDATNAASLNTVAVDCAAGPDALVLSRLAGLPDDAYENDGQLTKREVRAATLAALAPLPGRLLWDVGAGCGSIAIEWMRAGGRAIAVESHRGRAAMIARNAAALGVPDLDTVIGKAPAALGGLETPDAIFIGGGIRTDGMFDACWAGLRPGGRLVANTVTADSEALVASLREQHGGILTRIAISHAAPAGGQAGWQPKRPVTQWSVVK
jgi:precorrin-6Y C5,15-methyltransferase (decarboxylating)